MVSAICHYVITYRKTEKILGKIKGAYWQRWIQGKRVETLQTEKARKSWFNTRERQGMTKMVPRTKKKLLKQILHLQHTKQPVPWPDPYVKLRSHYQIHQERTHRQFRNCLKKAVVAQVEAQQRLWAGHH